jgi:RND family efflux transporter MFP subunit
VATSSAALVLFSIAGCSRKSTPAGPPSAGAELPIVRVAIPVEREVVEWAEFTGRLQAVDFVEIRSRVSGYLKSVEFQEGQLIEAGDLLFVVDPRPFEAALETAKANLEEAKARGEQAEAQLATAAANKLTAESNLEFTNSEFDRQKTLQQRNVGSQSDFDRARNEYKTASAQVQGSDAEIASARAAISTAKATIVTAQAAVNEAQLNLDYTRITAPVAGRTSRRNVTEGNLISGGNDQSVVLTTIVSLDPIYMLFDASEQQVLRFQRLILEGARKSARDVKYPAYMRLEDETGFPHRGYLDFVDNRFDPVTATMTARAIFENDDGILTPGMFGKLRIAETPAFDALLVPDAAVGTDQSDQFVYVVDADGTVAMRPIEAGSMALGLRIVRSGLNAGDQVVVGGIQRVRPGVRVTSMLETIEPDESVLGVEDATPEASE